MLRELGYTLGQGYHLARPMTAEDDEPEAAGRTDAPVRRSAN